MNDGTIRCNHGRVMRRVLDENGYICETGGKDCPLCPKGKVLIRYKEYDFNTGDLRIPADVEGAPCKTSQT